jgi:hypothetical protein
MRMAGFKKGWTNRRLCKATKRDGRLCGRLAMTRYGLSSAAASRRRLCYDLGATHAEKIVS